MPSQAARWNPVVVSAVQPPSTAHCPYMHRGIYSWDFEALPQRFLQPAIAALQPLMSVEVQSQVLYYTAARVGLQKRRHASSKLDDALMTEA